MDKTSKKTQVALIQSLRIYNSGQKERAIIQLAALCKKNKKSRKVKELFLKCVSDAGTDVPVDSRVVDEMLCCIDARVIDNISLIQAAGLLLNKDPVLNGLLELLRTGTPESNYDALQKGALRPVLTNKLFIGVLRNSIAPNATLELALTQLRRMILLSTAGNATSDFFLPGYGLEFFSALAVQSLVNEYTYYEEPDESTLVEDLIRKVQKKVTASRMIDSDLEWKLLLIAMYRPLHQLDFEDYAWDSYWPESLQPLVTEMKHWHQEQAIKKSIEKIGTIIDNTSLIVQTQYETNPYPRWQEFPIPKKTSMEGFLRQQFPAIQSPERFAHPVQMLVAGCGTGQEAIYNQYRIETSELLAIDLSKSSLAYAIRRAQELGVSDRIDFRQADVLQLGNFPGFHQHFDVICCSGVLHHMENPMEGWRILSEVQRPGGIMLIALYSELARRSVVSARERIAELGIAATPEGIRAFRRDILTMKYPELADLRWDPEIYNMSTCRDMLFHPQEWRYTPGQLKQMLDLLELEFVGFYGIDGARQRYRAMFPEDPDMINLDNWSIFEQQYPETFAAMYNLCVCKRDEESIPT